MATQKVMGPDQHEGKWYFSAYVNDEQVLWGPYQTEAFAQGALVAIARRINGEPVKGSVHPKANGPA